jgi:O-antigen/teichoic acid export membrane protein
MVKVNISWSMLGLVLPAIIAALAIPELVERLGNERFGFLGLVWALTGFGGIFDLGVGRAAVFFISNKLGRQDYGGVVQIYYASIKISLAAGLFGACLLIVATTLNIQSHFNYSLVTEDEIFICFLLVAAMVPMQALITTLRGVNEAFQEFKLISSVRIFNGVISFLGPVIVSFWSTNLVMLILPLLVAKIISLILSQIVSAGAIRRLEFAELHMIKDRRATYIQIMRFGGWATVSTVVSPLMTQADRFYIGVYISVAAVGVYVLPMEAMSQSLLLIGGITTVMYPLLSLKFSESMSSGLAIFAGYSRRINLLLFIIYFPLFFTIPYLLELWVDGVPAETAAIAQILCLGTFFNSLTGLKYSMIQGMGRADVTAKIHLIELPLYTGLVYILVINFGLLGAASAWSARMLVDLILMNFAFTRLVESRRKNEALITC